MIGADDVVATDVIVGFRAIRISPGPIVGDMRRHIRPALLSDIDSATRCCSVRHPQALCSMQQVKEKLDNACCSCTKFHCSLHTLLSEIDTPRQCEAPTSTVQHAAGGEKIGQRVLLLHRIGVLTAHTVE